MLGAGDGVEEARRVGREVPLGGLLEEGVEVEELAVGGALGELLDPDLGVGEGGFEIHGVSAAPPSKSAGVT